MRTFAENHSDFVKYHELDGITPEGRSVSYLYLTNGHTSVDKVRVWLQGGMSAFTTCYSRIMLTSAYGRRYEEQI